MTILKFESVFWSSYGNILYWDKFGTLTELRSNTFCNVGW
jgi:hypothetical protein